MMASTFRFLVLALATGTRECEAGNNGMALTPPMTWRSWNQLGWYINESVLLTAAAGLTDTLRPIRGMPPGTSLKDLGYSEVGMDEGWAVCPACQGGPGAPGGPNHGRDASVDPRAAVQRQSVPAPGFPIGDGKFSMFHRLDNTTGVISPVVDELLFPDMAGLVTRIHALGLTAGWYLNDCLSYCAQLGDSCPPEQCIPGDVRAFAEYGFDSLKIDGCSAQHGVDMWAQLINQTGIRARIENCNNGPKPEAGDTPLTERCPSYHQYRTGGDIVNSYDSWIHNAQEVAQFATTGRSGPTCWAYPDMLMVGVQGQTPDESNTGQLGPWAGGFVQPTLAEQRTHFGLWCVLSSPLTLSLDFANRSATDSVWDIITNTHAIAVNQAWAGEQGTVFAHADTNVTLRATCVFNSTCDNFGHGAPDGPTVPAWQAWCVRTLATVLYVLPRCGVGFFIINSRVLLFLERAALRHCCSRVVPRYGPWYVHACVHLLCTMVLFLLAAFV
jgi:alpha-galactosidase